MPRGKPLAGKREPGGGRKPLPPEQKRNTFSVRLDADVARRLESYQSDVPDYSRNSTINEAIRFYLDWQDVPEAEYEEIKALLKIRKAED